LLCKGFGRLKVGYLSPFMRAITRVSDCVAIGQTVRIEFLEARVSAAPALHHLDETKCDKLPDRRGNTAMLKAIFLQLRIRDGKPAPVRLSRCGCTALVIRQFDFYSRHHSVSGEAQNSV